jgi:hypothetical protein
MEIEVVVEDILDHTAQEGDVCPGTENGVKISLGCGLGEAGIYDNKLTPLFLGLGDPSHGDGVITGGVSPHY